MEGELWGLSTHPSKPLCVTASDDHSVRVWDLEMHRLKSSLPVNKPARCVAYSHNGRAIAVGMKDGERTKEIRVGRGDPKCERERLIAVPISHC